MPLPEAAQAVNKGVPDAAGSSVACPLGTLKPGESLAKLAYMVVAPSAEQADAEEQRLGEVGFGVLQESRDWWQEWYGDALAVETPDERINEFVPIQQYLCRIQQAEAGGYSPMYMYTTCWVRDSNGPVRFMTQTGKFEEVRRYLDYYYACCAQAKRIPMNWPLDLPVKTPLPTVDWSNAPTERAEVASFLILQHYWYWKQSGDLTPIKEHWEYLRRNLLGQHVDEQGRLPFHGDETYRFPGYQIFEATQKEPTDWVSMDLLSADSAWEYIAAAGALQTWAKMLGKSDEAAEYERLARRVRDALERDFRMPDRGYYAPAISDFSGEQYRYPFANISLGPAWLDAGLDGQSWSWLRPLDYLWKDSGTLKTTPGCGYYVGMTPGYLVWALATTRNPAPLRQAIEGLLDAASPAAEYAEMIAPNDDPTDKHWGKNRIRPWEGGINGEALVKALSGLQANPERRGVRLDPSIPKLTLRNIRVGDSFLDAECRLEGDDGTVLVSVRGAHPIGVGLGVLDLVEIKPGESRKLPFHRVPQVALSTLPWSPAPKPFDYGDPTFAGQARTIVVTWSKDTFAAHKGRPLPAAIDTKIAFPPEYLAAALYDAAGKRRADTLILDVAKYPGHCKTAGFWSEGEGRKIVDRFTALGGKVEQHPNPRDKPGDLFGE
ncbi:MAG: hypothetical protein FJZ97_12355 [Chloroflexi bacterium]|nr:hypothetical protein [Chloroflexota bacterium]